MSRRDHHERTRVELYTRGIKLKLKNHWAAWLPERRFAVGDIGVLNGHAFEKVGTLKGLNLAYYEVADSDSSPLTISSESGVSIAFKAAGETDDSFEYIGSAEAGAKVQLGAEGAFILQAPAVSGSEIGDRLNLRLQILDAFNLEKWEKDWLVITRLLRAPSATILISSSSNATLELTAKANLSGAVAGLGAADAGINIKHQQGDTVGMIGGKNLTPLFELSRLKTSFFSKPTLRTKSLRASDPSLAELTPLRARNEQRIKDSLTFEPLTDDELAQE